MRLPDIGAMNTAFLVTSLTAVLANFVLNKAQAVPGRVKNFVLRRVSVSVEVPERQYPFEAVKKFLAKQEYAFRTRAFSVVHRTDKLGADVWHLPPAPGKHYFWYRGRLAEAFRHRRELAGGENFAIFETLTVRIFFGTKELLEQFLVDADREHCSKDGVVGVYATSHWGSWDNAVHVPARPLATVVLPGDTAERLRADVGEFLEPSTAADYRQRGVPHRRGYLFHGEPGSGKTSTIKSLAAEFNKNLGVFSLSRTDDNKLMTLFMTLPKDTWPVLEDVDCLFDGRETSDAKVTFSGLLNALDGVASKEGYVLFMTTNHPEKLDPALVRPGRVDEKVYMGHATAEQAERYFGLFYGGEADLAREFGGKAGVGTVSMAAIQDHLLVHKKDPRKAVESFAA